MGELKRCCFYPQDRFVSLRGRSVAGHLEDGHSHVTPNAERNAESDAAQQRQLETGAARPTGAPQPPPRTTSTAAADGRRRRCPASLVVVGLDRRRLFAAVAARAFGRHAPLLLLLSGFGRRPFARLSIAVLIQVSISERGSGSVGFSPLQQTGKSNNRATEQINRRSYHLQ